MCILINIFVLMIYYVYYTIKDIIYYVYEHHIFMKMFSTKLY